MEVHMTEITVYTARRLWTMELALPLKSAVAVRDGRIIEVETMQPWLQAHAHNIDERFSNHVIMPGFIDPLLHPSMAALLLRRHFTQPWNGACHGRMCPAPWA
jgi:predicted amidohydrolase YtcJ